jgi:outer membrane biosynthesis protein TonB
LALRIMYRVIAILGGALVLSACSSMPDFMKPAPITDTVRFESDPPGAEATTSNGQTCQTPCALALSVDAPLTVTFTLNGYQPATESIEPTMTTGFAQQMRPNPVTVELTPAPPPSKPVKKPIKKKPVPKKKPLPKKKPPTAATPVAGPKPAAATAPAPASAPMLPAPAESQAPSPSLAPAPPPASH